MKLSELLKKPDKHYEVILFDDVYEIALIFENSFYYVCTLCFDEVYFCKTLACYFDCEKRSAEKAYNLLLEFSKIHYKGGE